MQPQNGQQLMNARDPLDGRSDWAREQLAAECRRLADLATPEDTVSTLAERTGMSRRTVQRRLERMERELGLDPAAPAERAAARFQPSNARRAGAVAKRWRRFAL